MISLATGFRTSSCPHLDNRIYPKGKHPRKFPAGYGSGIFTSLMSKGAGRQKSLCRLPDIEMDLLLGDHCGVITGKTPVQDFIRSWLK